MVLREAGPIPARQEMIYGGSDLVCWKSRTDGSRSRPLREGENP
jgi:hypothetical protein